MLTMFLSMCSVKSGYTSFTQIVTTLQRFLHCNNISLAHLGFAKALHVFLHGKPGALI